MAARNKATNKAAKRKTTRKKAPASKRLTPRKEKRGLEASEVRLDLDADEIAPLVAEVERAGGAPIGAYREPFSGRPQLVASLPVGAVEPTPFQPDLSPTQTKGLAAKIEESGSFLDPLIVVRAEDDRFSSRTLVASLRERYAARLLAIDTDVKRIIAELQERGSKSPYLRSDVVARINPVRFHRAKQGDATPPMAMGAGLTRMATSTRKFDAATVRHSDLALVAAVASAE